MSLSRSFVSRSRRATGAALALAVLVPGAALAGPGDAGVSSIGALGTKAIFSADDGVVGNEPWISDGSTAGTTLLLDVNPSGGSFPDRFTKAGSYLFFTANGGSGTQLWRTNGTAAGTIELPKGGYTFPANLTEMNGILYFTTITPAEQGEVWRSDGTVAGTKPVTAIGGTDATVVGGTVTKVGTRLLFVVDGTSGFALYRTSGSLATTAKVKSLPGPAELFANAAGTLFFVVSDSPGSWALWKSDGTRAGTVKVKALPAEPDDVVAVGARVYLSVGTEATGTELWISNGTAAGTKLVKEIYPGADGSEPEEMVAFGARLAFVAYSKGQTADDYEIWMSDGTKAGTRMLKDINPDGYGNPFALTVIGTRLWFQAEDGSTGTELFSSDGTAAGTKRRADINPATGDSFPDTFTKVGSRVYFAAADGTHGRELWRSTDTGFKMVKDIN